MNDQTHSNLVAFPGPPAREISERMLRVTGTCLMQGKAELFADLVHLPQEMETLTGRRTLRTRAEMIDLCLSLHAHFRAEGITHLDRHCLHAEYLSPTKIVSTHQSRNWRGDQLVSGPFNSIGTLERIDGAWKITYARYAISDNPRQEAVLLGLHDG